VFEINLKAAVEGYSSFSDPNNFLRTQEFTGNTSLTFPEILFPLKSVRKLFRHASPKTKLLAGATLIKRPEYDRLNIKNSLSYGWSPSMNKVFNYSLIDVNVINTLRRSEAFNTYLDNLQDRVGSNLKYSFSNSFVSNTNFSYTYNNNNINSNEKSKYFKGYVEAGGLLFNIPGLAPNDSIFGLKTYRYFKGNWDMRFYRPQGKKNTFAMRVNIGIAIPYDKAGALPYEKYFFAGGSNSLRAWRPRRLGPGGYIQLDPNDSTITNKYEQPGELLFENNYEYRFHVISFIDGALFVDIGNVWNIRKETNEDHPEKLFKFNTFFQQIAVGTGFGVRFNFSFLILRFDVGIKAYNPGMPTGSRFVLPDVFKKPPFGSTHQTVLNIGIGYPF
jgi:outer membrane protein assembly factor BamA